MSEENVVKNHLWLEHVLGDIQEYARINDLHTMREAIIFAQRALMFDVTGEGNKTKKIKLRLVEPANIGS